MWPCVLPVSQHRNAVDMFDPRPAPLLITCGPSLVSISQSQSKGMYIDCVPQLHAPFCKVHVGSACVLSWGFCSSSRPQPREGGRGGGGWGGGSKHQQLWRGEKPWTPTGGMTPFCFSWWPQLLLTLLLAAKPSCSRCVGGGPEPAGPLLC